MDSKYSTVIPVFARTRKLYFVADDPGILQSEKYYFLILNFHYFFTKSEHMNLVSLFSIAFF